MTNNLNLFTRPAELCFCVPNGQHLCAFCRDRRNIKPPISNLTNGPKSLNRSAHDWIDTPENNPIGRLINGKIHWFPNHHADIFEKHYLKPEHYNLTEGEPCPNCGNYLIIYHKLDGCSCHLHPPCSYCTESSLTCSECDIYIDIPDA